MTDQQRSPQAIFYSSTWTIDAKQFRSLRKSQGLSQQVTAVLMGFGNCGQSPDHAASHLSRRLGQSAPIRGRAIHAAACALHVSPYVFAKPLRTFDTAELCLAVAQVINDTKIQSLTALFGAEICATLEAAGVKETNALDFNEAIASTLSGKLRQETVSVTDLYEHNFGKSVGGDDALAIYVKLNRHQAIHASTNKLAIDTTGGLSDFQSWDRYLFQKIVEDDELYVSNNNRIASQRRVRRVFVVNPAKLDSVGLGTLSRNLTTQHSKGIELGIKVWNRSEFDPVHMGDISIFGDWGVDMGIFESTIGRGVRAPVGEMFVHRSDSARFNKLSSRLEWASSDSEIDVLVRRSEEIPEIISNLARQSSLLGRKRAAN